MSDVDATLAERGSRYGDFKDNARVSQVLKSVMHATPSWTELTDVQKEGLEMIQHKIARMLNGDPTYLDNIVDIIGYATLVKEAMEAVDGVQKKVGGPK